jgi:hypothetical protein
MGCTCFCSTTTWADPVKIAHCFILLLLCRITLASFFFFAAAFFASVFFFAGEGRNPYWLSAGLESGGEILWSAPEIILFDRYLR